MVLTQVAADFDIDQPTTIVPRPARRNSKTSKTEPPSTTTMRASSSTTTTTTTPRTTTTQRTTTAPTTKKPASVRSATRAPEVTSKPRATHAPGLDPYAAHDPMNANYKYKTATHAPWDPYAAHDPKNTRNKQRKTATHAPWPSMYNDQYGQQNEHFFPAKSTYAPYVYGKDPQKAKKKLIPFSVLDKDIFTNLAKDFVSYLAAPFLMPSAIANAVTNAPAGLETETLWGKIARSLKSAFLKREMGSKRGVENRNSEVTPNGDKSTLLASVLKNRIIPILSLLNASIKDGTMTAPLPKGGVTKVDRAKSVDAKNDALMSRLVDFIRWRRHRTNPAAPSV